MADSEERQEDYRQRIGELEHLSSPPASLDRILELTGNSEAGVTELSEAIRMDPAITARVLRLANSAYYGFSRRVDSVDEAIMVVGFRNVRNLATCAALAPVFSGGHGALQREDVWRHSCAVAEGTRLVAAHRGPDDGGAYVSGLLHDLGQVVLDELEPDLYAEVIERQTAEPGPLRAVEREILGVDHAWAGAALCESWHLSPRIAGSVLHHVDAVPERHPDAALVALAEHLCVGVQLPDPLDTEPGEPPHPRILRALRLSPAEVDSLTEQLAERREAIDQLFRASVGDDE